VLTLCHRRGRRGLPPRSRPSSSLPHPPAQAPQRRRAGPRDPGVGAQRRIRGPAFNCTHIRAASGCMSTRAARGPTVRDATRHGRAAPEGGPRTAQAANNPG